MTFIYNLPSNLYVLSEDFFVDNHRYLNFSENIKFILNNYVGIKSNTEYPELANIDIFQNLCKSKNENGDQYINMQYQNQIKSQIGNNIFIGEINLQTGQLLSGCTLNFIYDVFDKNIIGIFIYTFCSSIGTKQRGEALLDKIKLLLNALIETGYIVSSGGVGVMGYDIIFNNNGRQTNLKNHLSNFSFIALNPTLTSLQFYRNNEFNFYDEHNNLLYYVEKNDNIIEDEYHKKYLKYKQKYLKLKNKK